MPELWPFQPEIGSSETLTWFTDVLGSRTGEQRIMLRPAPRQTFHYIHLLEARSYLLAKRLARQNGALSMYVPVWVEGTDLEVTLSSSATVITLDTTSSDYRIGGRVVVWTDEESYVVKVIGALDSTSLTLTSSLGRTFVKPLVAPVRTAFINGGMSTDRGSRVNQVEISFQVQDNTDLSLPAPVYVQYGGFDLMMDRPELIETVSENIVRAAEYCDNGFGPIVIEDTKNYVDFGQTVSFREQRGAELWFRRQWLHFLRGQQGVFWLPSFSGGQGISELELTVDALAAATTVRVLSIGPSGFYVDRHILIQLNDGTLIPRLVTSAGAFNSTDDTLLLDSALGVDVDVSDVYMFCFLSLVRLNTDEVTINHDQGFASSLVLPVMEMPNPSENAGGGPDSLAIAGSPVLSGVEDVSYSGFTVSATGGVEPYTYSLRGSWPTGVTINSLTGAVSGTPVVDGTFTNLSVRATDHVAGTDDLPTFTLTVDPGAGLQISGTPVLDAVEDTAYSGFTVSAVNGTPPYVYSLRGSWPTGVTINGSTGAVSGTPTVDGTFTSLSVRVTDDVAATDDLPTFTLSVDAAAGLAISGTPVLSAVEDDAYGGFTVSATSGTPPYVYSLVGSWPTGITINSSTGAVSGTPTDSGTFASLSVRVTDNVADTDDLPSFTLVVDAAGGFVWPSALNTGYTGVLTEYTGPSTITVNGTIIQDKHISNSIRVMANDVQFLNCHLEFDNYWGIDADGYSGLVVDHCTITGTNRNNSCILTGTASTVTNCNLSGMENGIMQQGSNFLVDYNYIHALDGGSALAHVDGIQIAGDNNDGVVTNNWVESWDTSCVFIKADFGPIDSITVDHNTLINRPGFITAAPCYSYSVGGNLATNISYTNNRLQPGNGDYLLTFNSTPTFTGNTDYDTGNPI